MSFTLTEWFAVLPGTSSAGQRATSRLKAADPGACVLARHDGQPWIIGRSTRALTVAHSAGRTAALIGAHDVGEGQLAQALPLAAADGSAGALMCWAGSYHAVLATSDETWVCGDVAGMRPVFWVECGDAVLVGDHARLLAEATGTVTIDTAYLALHLLGPVPPLALAESGATGYQGVRAVPPGSALRLDGVGRTTVRQWWRVPDDERTLGEGAPVLRDALRRAIAVRTDGESVVGCELSGGADSTALSALAYGHVGGERLINLTRAPADPGNDDLDWARRAAGAQPGARHDILDVGVVPAQFLGLEAPFALDAPSPSAASPRRAAFWWDHAASAEVRVLLSGKGGDELMPTALSYLTHARRRDRAASRRHIKGWAALWGVPEQRVKAQAADPGPYQRWLADCLTRGRDDSPGWEAGPYAPPWLTGWARTMLADTLRAAADRAEPLHERPHQHATMAAIRALARWNRLQSDAASPFGIQLAYPYADQQVIEAALATRAEARTSPYQNKPLLMAAMSGLVPAANLARRTKGGYSSDTAAAARPARAMFAKLLSDDSELARCGLIDPDRLRTALRGWDRADDRTDLLLHLTLMCEVWARTTSNRPLPTPVPFEETPC
ncbi:asparagine synthase-related protein [Streptomyces sp. SRF1]|uniref:asparagine synthase-related protein n=1 Tax=Streptomyces sp. SRF1 TaxID=1549642 RepID=UPI0025B0B340|nr:asparagine synthase-related protein [Streptomyces sp. SRF1]MDN3058317.1 asparagine synthase-related protein [Streptomyces sp. SRF1]